MGKADFYRAGSWNRICDRCGAKRKAEDTAKEWTGLIVCVVGCFDHRHPQDFVRGRADMQSVPDPRPEFKEYLRMDVTHLKIDDPITRIDFYGDRFIDTNEVTSEDL